LEVFPLSNTKQYWRIAKVSPQMEREVIEVMIRESRSSISNTLARLISEALDARRVADNRNADTEMQDISRMARAAEKIAARSRHGQLAGRASARAKRQRANAAA
jgi:hypothetical protein